MHKFSIRCFILFISLSNVSFGLLGQPTPIPTDTEEIQVFFPNDLHCDEALPGSAGFVWMGIRVGKTTIDDAIEILEEEGFERKNHPGKDITYTRDRDHTPHIVSMCETDNIVSMIMLVDYKILNIAQLISSFKIPDETTWPRSTFEHRLAFWFDKGLAVEFITPYGQNSPLDVDNELFGDIVSIFIFAPQSSETAEDNWPYNRTITQEDLPEGPGMTLPIKNPVNYEKIFADELESVSTDKILDLPGLLEYLPIQDILTPTATP